MHNAQRKLFSHSLLFMETLPGNEVPANEMAKNSVAVLVLAWIRRNLCKAPLLISAILQIPSYVVLVCNMSLLCTTSSALCSALYAMHVQANAMEDTFVEESDDVDPGIVNTAEEVAP